MRINTVILLLLVALPAAAQVHLAPIVGISSTRLKLSDEFRKGGNYPLVGVEIEGRLKPKKISLSHVSLVTGVTYLANGFHQNSQFSFPSISFYSSHTLDLSTQYVQVPLMLKFNWQVFPLVEDFVVFVGAGASASFLMKATLAEKYTGITFPADAFSPPKTTHSEDSRDVTSMGASPAIFARFDLGMRFRRLQVSFRLSISQQDMYFKGLENSWNVPSKNSDYIGGHETSGTITEKYSEFVIAYRIF